MLLPKVQLLFGTEWSYVVTVINIKYLLFLYIILFTNIIRLIFFIAEWKFKIVGILNNVEKNNQIPSVAKIQKLEHFFNY